MKQSLSNSLPIAFEKSGMQNSLIFIVSEFHKCHFPRERRHPCGVSELVSSNINTAWSQLRHLLFIQFYNKRILNRQPLSQQINHRSMKLIISYLQKNEEDILKLDFL